MRSSLGVSLLLVLAVFANDARADEATARQLFKRGIDLYDKKQYAPALEQFQKAYAEKPSAGIEQNIALTLKALGKNVEAATAFDEAIDEGEGTLKPEVRAAMEQELASLSKLVATIRFSFVTTSDHTPFTGAVVVKVDGVALSAPHTKRAIRLEPGIHVFAAHADALPDPVEKRLSLLAGSPVDATFEMGAPMGTLTVTPSVASAFVTVDGVLVSKNAWPLRLPAGPHRVVATAKGFATVTADVAVSADAGVEYPIALLPPGSEPPPYEPRPRPPPKPQKQRYLVPALAYEGQSFRLSPLLGEPPGGGRHQFSGGALTLTGGYRLSRFFAVELHSELGEVGSTYRLDGAAGDSNTTVTQWQLLPGLRFTTSGPLRLTFASSFGVHGQIVNAHIETLPTSNTSTELKGDGISVSWLNDLGLQVDVGPLFLEALVFLDLHGVGTTTEDQSGVRMLYSSPSTRSGISLGLGIPF